MVSRPYIWEGGWEVSDGESQKWELSSQRESEQTWWFCPISALWWQSHSRQSQVPRKLSFTSETVVEHLWCRHGGSGSIQIGGHEVQHCVLRSSLVFRARSGSGSIQIGGHEVQHCVLRSSLWYLELEVDLVLFRLVDIQIGGHEVQHCVLRSSDLELEVDLCLIRLVYSTNTLIHKLFQKKCSSCYHLCLWATEEVRSS